MKPVEVYFETGKRKTFAVAPEWPGWSRWGKDENAALDSLLDHAPRYAAVLQSAGIPFPLPAGTDPFTIVERLPGDATTDFGAPSSFPASDARPIDPDELDRLQKILQACWTAFDSAAGNAAGAQLRRGPRGGGRDLERIHQHMIDGDRSYLPRVVWKYRLDKTLDLGGQMRSLRAAVLDALTSAVENGLPEKGPRRGSAWTPRFFARRVAWHTLDHAWEIEDRIE
jgi:hypothetical protein